MKESYYEALEHTDNDTLTEKQNELRTASYDGLGDLHKLISRLHAAMTATPEEKEDTRRQMEEQKANQADLNGQYLEEGDAMVELYYINGQDASYLQTAGEKYRVAAEADIEYMLAEIYIKLTD